MRLSDRLEKIIAMTKPCRMAADIGTDHGFVPIELVRRGISEGALACDVRKGPLQRAEAHVRRAGLSEKISCRLGDGLKPLGRDEADCVIIAGMGGTLMAEILEAGSDVLTGLRELILSPHTDPQLVRQELCRLNFGIEEEQMVLEDGKYYVMMRAVPSGMMPELSEEELLYGPCLLRERPEIFLDYLKAEEGKMEELLGKLSSEKESEHLKRRRLETETSLERIRRMLV